MVASNKSHQQPVSPENTRALFARFQKHGEGRDKFLPISDVEAALMQHWPSLKQHPIVAKTALERHSQLQAGSISEQEFQSLLLYLSAYEQFYQQFTSADTNHDGRVSFDEFRKAHDSLFQSQPDKNPSKQQLKDEFAKLDADGNGYASFAEFCDYMATQHVALKSGRDGLASPVTSPMVGRRAENTLRSDGKRSQSTRAADFSRLPFPTPKLDDKITSEQIHQLFEFMDANHSNELSMEEVMDGIRKVWPDVAQHQRALQEMAAEANRSNNNLLEEQEFANLIHFIAYYHSLYAKLSQADSNGDNQVSYAEFEFQYFQHNPDANRKQAEKEFKLMNPTPQNTISIEDYCIVMSRAFAKSKRSVFQKFMGMFSSDKPTQVASTEGKQQQQEQKSPAKGGKFAAPKLSTHLSDADVHRLFQEFDVSNNNGMLSLAEIDKSMCKRLLLIHPHAHPIVLAIQRLWPEMYKHRRAFIRAYKAADVNNDGFIREKEFTTLLRFLAYYDQLYQQFNVMDNDDDHRITLSEFKKGHDLAGIKLTEKQMEEVFRRIDVNGGGVILFDEFCIFMAKAYKPHDLHMDLAEQAAKNDTADDRKQSKRVTVSATAKPSSPQPQQQQQSSRSQAPTPAQSGKFKVPNLTTNLTNEEVHQLFLRFDATNQNGLLSLAEIDKAVLDLWPDMYKHRRALIRAYNAGDHSDDGFITENEFADLLRFLAYYDLLYQQFDLADTDDDHRMDFSEFKKSYQALGMKLSEAQLQAEFEKMDHNGGGLVLFDEFCMYMARNQRQGGMDARLMDVAAKNGTGAQRVDQASRGAQRQQQPPQQVSGKAPLPAIKNQTPAKQQQQQSQSQQQQQRAGQPTNMKAKYANIPPLTYKMSNEELRELFERFDAANQNGLLSLAEIDKNVKDFWPEMYKHRPALMRAYKAADKSRDGFITFPEFTDLLRFLSYYDTLYQMFDTIDSDDDRRMTFEEFKQGHVKLGIKLPESRLREEFDRMDHNLGGMILFDEFCMYMAKTFRPKGVDQAMSDRAAENGTGAPAASKLPAIRNAPPKGTATMQPSKPSGEPTQSNFQKRFAGTPRPQMDSKPSTRTQTAAAPRREVATAESPVASPMIRQTKRTGAQTADRSSDTSASNSPAMNRPRTYAGAEDALRNEIQALERNLQREQLEKRKLETTILALREQLVKATGGLDDAHAQRQITTFEAVNHQNVLLQEKLQQERQQVLSLESTLRQMREQMLALQTEERKNRAGQDGLRSLNHMNQVVALQQELHHSQSQRQKFERQLDTVARKLAEEQEHSKKLQAEILLLRSRQHVTESGRARKVALDEAIESNRGFKQ